MAVTRSDESIGGCARPGDARLWSDSRGVSAGLSVPRCSGGHPSLVVIAPSLTPSVGRPFRCTRRLVCFAGLSVVLLCRGSTGALPPLHPTPCGSRCARCSRSNSGSTSTASPIPSCSPGVRCGGASTSGPRRDTSILRGRWWVPFLRRCSGSGPTFPTASTDGSAPSGWRRWFTSDSGSRWAASGCFRPAGARRSPRWSGSSSPGPRSTDNGSRCRWRQPRWPWARRERAERRPSRAGLRWRGRRTSALVVSLPFAALALLLRLCVHDGTGMDGRVRRHRPLHAVCGWGLASPLAEPPSVHPAEDALFALDVAGTVAGVGVAATLAGDGVPRRGCSDRAGGPLDGPHGLGCRARYPFRCWRAGRRNPDGGAPGRRARGCSGVDARDGGGLASSPGGAVPGPPPRRPIRSPIPPRAPRASAASVHVWRRAVSWASPRLER